MHLPMKCLKNVPRKAPKIDEKSSPRPNRQKILSERYCKLYAKIMKTRSQRVPKRTTNPPQNKRHPPKITYFRPVSTPSQQPVQGRGLGENPPLFRGLRMSTEVSILVFVFFFGGGVVNQVPGKLWEMRLPTVACDMYLGFGFGPSRAQLHP